MDNSTKVGPFEFKYGFGNSYNETWERTEKFCPECGTRSVWVECGDGDYYDGPQFACLSCRAFGCKWYGDVRGCNWQDQQRLEAIKAAIG